MLSMQLCFLTGIELGADWQWTVAVRVDLLLGFELRITCLFDWFKMRL